MAEQLISRAFIHKLLAYIDVVELINSRITLKKSGVNYKACCPFHQENTPSFTVNRDKQFYYCFGCGRHGNAIDFIMNFDRLQFIETIEELATISGLKIPYVNSNRSKFNFHYRNKLYCLMKEITLIYQKYLLHDNAIFARQYLAKRGLTTAIIEYFSLGFAPSGTNLIQNHLKLHNEYRQLLYDTGMLVITNHQYSYERFRYRIMFPIRDKRGRVIGFGGRVLGNMEPKYLNSPNTILFHKGRQLYGLYEVYQKHSRPIRLLVVEGYMDVVTLTQAGIDYVVASLGTSITSDHIHLLFRNTDHVIYCYDGDNAGRAAAWRALKLSLPYMFDGRQLSFMFLPQGEDPDTLIRKEGKVAFEKRINQVQPLSIFMFEKLIKQVDLSHPDGRARLTALALPLIKLIPGETLRIYLRQALGKKVGILEDNYLEKLLPILSKNSNYRLPLLLKHTTMRILMSLLVQNPRLAVLVPELQPLTTIKLAGLPMFINLLKTCIAYPHITTGQILELYRNSPLINHIEKFASWNHMIIKKEVENTFKDALTSIYNLALEQRQEMLIAIDRTTGLSFKQRQELWYLNQVLAKKS
ncbi:MAG: DNA primase [Candidatus Dasytiphilus stammeri]